jgi:ARG and Rhodanese-Phosphatase-superfamily-associated Protein domain
MKAVWAAAMAATIGVTVATAAEARISGPYQSGNLSVFLIHAEPADGGGVAGAYLTLDEALAGGEAAVYETGDVNELEVQNKSKDHTLFIQAGDIVKGGRQDRVLSVDLILPPGSGKIPITAFCVEQGRWSARGDESGQQFASAEKSLAGKDLKLAAKSKRSQTEVWNAVAETQAKLAASVGEDVAAPASPTSLQLSLENTKVAEAVGKHVAALTALAADHPDAVGYLYAVNGKISGGDIYASPLLFRKLWPRLLEASVTEAVAERSDSSAGSGLAADDAAAFLTAMDSAAATDQHLPAGVTLMSRETEKAAAFETRSDAAEGWLHRSYIVK